jgi:ATP-dependent DNA ligase
VIRPAAGVLYAQHCDGHGCALFARVCAEDLEGIVAKAKRGRYDPARASTWVKIKNRDYSQARDRHELFERRSRH